MKLLENRGRRAQRRAIRGLPERWMELPMEAEHQNNYTGDNVSAARVISWGPRNRVMAPLNVQISQNRLTWIAMFSHVRTELQVVTRRPSRAIPLMSDYLRLSIHETISGHTERTRPQRIQPAVLHFQPSLDEDLTWQLGWNGCRGVPPACKDITVCDEKQSPFNPQCGQTFHKGSLFKTFAQLWL